MKDASTDEYRIVTTNDEGKHTDIRKLRLMLKEALEETKLKEFLETRFYYD